MCLPLQCTTRRLPANWDPLPCYRQSSSAKKLHHSRAETAAYVAILTSSPARTSKCVPQGRKYPILFSLYIYPFFSWGLAFHLISYLPPLKSPLLRASTTLKAFPTPVCSSLYSWGRELPSNPLPKGDSCCEDALLHVQSPHCILAPGLTQNISKAQIDS